MLQGAGCFTGRFPENDNVWMIMLERPVIRWLNGRMRGNMVA